MNPIKETIKGFFEIDNLHGKLSNVTYEEIRRINLTNYIALVCVANIIGYSILYAFLDFKLFLPALIFHSFNILVTIFIIIINKRGHFKTAKILLCAFIPIMIALVASVIFGTAPGFQIFILISLLIPTFIWSYNEKVYLFGFIAFNLFLYIGIEFFPPIFDNLIDIPENYISNFQNSNILICFLGAGASIITYLFFSDLTEKKLLAQTRELKNFQEEKNKIYSIIAHDLKGPISTINGLVELLLRETNELGDNRFNDILKALSTTSASTQALLENLLDWSKMNQANIPLRKELISVNECVKKTINIFNYQIQEKGHTINVDINKNIQLFLDTNLLCAVFRNLISNAIKFTPNKGLINITGKRKNNVVEICVADSGIGMSKEIQNNLFNPSKSVTMPGTNNEIGTGLGLVICKDFIEKNGGEFWVESTLNKGSKFYFTLVAN